MRKKLKDEAAADPEGDAAKEIKTKQDSEAKRLAVKNKKLKEEAAADPEGDAQRISAPADDQGERGKVDGSEAPDLEPEARGAQGCTHR